MSTVEGNWPSLSWRQMNRVGSRIPSILTVGWTVKEWVVAPLDWTTPKTFLVPFHSRVLPVCILKTRPICVVDKRKVVAFDLVDVPYILVCLGIRLIFFHWVLLGHCCCDFLADSETLFILIRQEVGSRRVQAKLRLDSKKVSWLHGKNVFWQRRYTHMWYNIFNTWSIIIKSPA